MASPGVSSFCAVGYLFAIAMVTSMLWYMFWMVLSPVKDDIAPLVNWYGVGVAWVGVSTALSTLWDGLACLKAGMKGEFTGWYVP
jgi:uncharacterized membrane protein